MSLQTLRTWHKPCYGKINPLPELKEELKYLIRSSIAKNSSIAYCGFELPKCDSYTGETPKWLVSVITLGAKYTAMCFQ